MPLRCKQPARKTKVSRRRPAAGKRRKTVGKRRRTQPKRKIKRVTKRRAERPGPPQSAKLAHPSDTARGNDGRMYKIATRRRKTGKCTRYQVWIPV